MDTPVFDQVLAELGPVEWPEWFIGWALNAFILEQLAVALAEGLGDALAILTGG